MQGSITLIGGPPGIGKSTLMLQLANMLGVSAARSGDARPVAYVSGEESLHQLKLRGDRLRVDAGRIHVLNETCLDAVLRELCPAADSPPFSAVVVDSVQTLYLDGSSSAPGSVSQVRGARRMRRVQRQRRPPHQCCLRRAPLPLTVVLTWLRRAGQGLRGAANAVRKVHGHARVPGGACDQGG